MPQKVESFPLGLRELLGRGDPPPAFTFFPENLTPTIDVSPFLLLAKRRVLNQGGTAAAVGNVATIPVPAGEIWWMHWAVCFTDILDADQAIEFTINARVGGLAFRGDLITVAASRRGAATLDNGSSQLILKGGDLVEMTVEALTVGAAGSVGLGTNVLFSLL